MRSSVVRPVRPFVRSACASRTQLASDDGVRSNSRAVAPIVLPSSNTSRTAPALNSSLNCRRTRRPDLLDPILAIVSAFRMMSTRSGQAQTPSSELRDPKPKARGIELLEELSRACH